MIPTKDQLIDLFFRSLWTAIKTGCAVLLGNSLGVVNIAALQAAELAALGSVISVLQVFASQRLEAGSTGNRLMGG